MKKTNAPSSYKIEVVEKGPLHLLLRFSGDLSTVNTHLFLADLKKHLSGKLAKKITFDFSGVGYFDSTAAAVRQTPWNDPRAWGFARPISPSRDPAPCARGARLAAEAG